MRDIAWLRIYVQKPLCVQGNVQQLGGLEFV